MGKDDFQMNINPCHWWKMIVSGMQLRKCELIFFLTSTIVCTRLNRRRPPGSHVFERYQCDNCKHTRLSLVTPSLFAMQWVFLSWMVLKLILSKPQTPNTPRSTHSFRMRTPVHNMRSTVHIVHVHLLSALMRDARKTNKHVQSVPTCACIVDILFYVCVKQCS